MITNEEIIDPQIIQRLEKLGGGSFLFRMAELFNKNSQEKVHALFKAWEAQDYQTIKRSAHSLISSAGNVGATRMKQLASEVETLAEAQNPSRFPALLYELRSAYEQAAGRLETITQGRAS